LQRLEQKHLITSRGGSTPGNGGRPARHYVIAEEGLVALRRAKAEIQKAWGDFGIAER
jgi:DNA-binding PadR family transcriptional regulator